jgi:hypothetical protein
VANLAFASVAIKSDPVSRSAKTLRGVLAASRQSLSQAANWGCAMTFASHFAVVTTLSGVWGIPMVAHFFNISPSAASTPLLVFMVGNAIGSIFLGHAADKTAASLDTALIRICLLRMVLIAMLLPPVAHALGLLYVTIVFAALGLVAGGTVPFVLKCTKRLYTADLIGVGASVNTTAAEFRRRSPIPGSPWLARLKGTGAAHPGGRRCRLWFLLYSADLRARCRPAADEEQVDRSYVALMRGGQTGGQNARCAPKRANHGFPPPRQTALHCPHRVRLTGIAPKAPASASPDPRIIVAKRFAQHCLVCSQQRRGLGSTVGVRLILSGV